MMAKSSCESVELDIVIQKEINNTFYNALPLCILLTNDNLRTWFYERYIQCCCHDNHFLDYIEGDYTWSTHRGFFEIIPLGVSSAFAISDIVNFTKECIKSGYYVLTFLDEYYLESKINYKQKHFIHESLVFGFDDDEAAFMAIAFDKNDSYSKLAYKYNSFLTAHSFARENISYVLGKNLVTLYRLNDINRQYPFSINRFYTQLNNFFTSSIDSHDAFMLSTIRPWVGNYSFGLDAYNNFIYYIKNNLYEDHLKSHYDIKQFHFIKEHKRIIYNRMSFLKSQFQTDSCFTELLAEYNKIVESSAIIRNQYVRLICYAESNSNYVHTDQYRRKIDELASSVKDLVRNEVVILEKCLEYIKHLLK